MSERSLQNDILIAWGPHPQVRIWRANSGQAFVPTRTGSRPVTMNVPGCPDLIGWLDNGTHALFLGIEVKSPVGRLRESQIAFRAVLTRMHGIYILARSVEDVDAALAPLGVRR